MDIRLPQINGKTEREMLTQIRSYLYQLAPQLQFALENISTRQETISYSNSQSGASQSLSGTSGGASNASPQDTFNSLKALIIKSADIVNAYYEEISERLEGEYRALSEFGEFTEMTSQEIEKTSTNINLAFTNIQTIDTSITGINDTIRDIDKDIADVKGTAENAYNSVIAIEANIRTGVLDTENGVDIYGIEVGQKNKVNGVETFNKYARFTANKLSFYDKSGVEVAYISDNKLYITQAEITGTLKLGGYQIDTTKGLAFKWAGRG